VTKSTEPFSPKYPIEPEAYDRLYAFNHGTDDFLGDHSPWQEIRIRSGLSEEQIYQLLPSAAGYEYGGYVTKSRIRYRRCESTEARLPMSKPCTFHSHPTSLITADLPSASDVLLFLNFRHLRSVIVGSSRILVWDKTKPTMEIVKKLSSWSDANMVAEVRRLEKEFPNGWHDPYAKLALKNLGLIWPKSQARWSTHWETMLRNILKIRVRVFPRTSGAKS
jgi:hypothetical protein